MADRLSPRDFQTLSEYLDNQLPSSKRSALEERISKSSELSQALNDLRLVKRVLRTQGFTKAPHNLLLSPSQVRQKSPPIISFPVLRLATVLASLLLVFFVIGDLFATTSMMSTQTPVGALDEVMPMEAALPVEVEEAMERPVEEAVIEAPAAQEAPTDADLEMIPPEEPPIEALMESEALPAEEPPPGVELKAMKAPTSIPTQEMGLTEEFPSEPSGGGSEGLAPSEADDGADLTAESRRQLEMPQQSSIDQQTLRAEAIQQMGAFLGISRVWLSIIEIFLILVIVIASIAYIQLRQR